VDLLPLPMAVPSPTAASRADEFLHGGGAGLPELMPCLLHMVVAAASP
jgi:hypothetical protein